MANAFLSYKRENLSAVQPLVKALRDEGVEVWWDQDISPGAAWEQTIEAEHKAAKAVIVAWSRAAVQSENVKAEARGARNEGRLLQIFIETCEPPLFFGERQGLNFTGWNGSRTDRRFVTLLSAIQALSAGKAPPQGVGFAPKRRNWTASLWSGLVALSVVLGLIGGSREARDAACAWPWLSRTCIGLHIKAPPPPPPPDPQIVAEAARQRLIASLNGEWDRQDGDCRIPVLLATSLGADGVGRLKVSRGGTFNSEGQIIGAGDGAVTSRDIAVRPGVKREVWEYRPKGDQVTVLDPNGVSTTLIRCTLGGAQ